MQTNRLHIKKTSLYFLVTIFMATLGCNTPSKSLVSLRVGHLVALDMAPTFVAKEAGYFEEEGLDVTLSSFGPYGNDAALAKGDIDISITPFTLPYIARNQGVPIQAIAAAGGWGVMEIIIHQDHQISSLKDLSHYVARFPNQKIKIATYKGDSIDLLLKDALKTQDLSYDNFEVVWFSNIFEMVEAFKRQEVGILTHIKPYTTDLIQNHGGVHLTDSTEIWDPQTPNCVIAVLDSFLLDHTDTAKKYLRAIQKAAHLINSNPEKAVQLLRDSKYPYFKVPYDTVLQGLKKQPYPIGLMPKIKNMNLVALRMAQEGYIQKYTSGRKIFNLDLLKSLERS